MAKIYISSTFEDLKEYRKAVYDTLRQWRHDAIAMEDYVATDERPIVKCLKDVSESDIYIGIFAWRYGFIPSGEKKSITELEYDGARKTKKPCFIFILDEDALWLPKLMDKDLSKIENLRQKLQNEQTVSFFNSVDDLRAKLPASLKRILSSDPTEIIAPYESELKTKYLNWIMAESSLLSLSGIDPDTAREKREDLNLGSIYTALLTHSSSDEDRQHLKEKQAKPMSALEMLNKHQHLVILGDPGSGKSTFVNFAAWCLAGETVQNAYANLERLTSPLPDKDGKDQKERQKWDHGPLVPVRIILRDFAVCGLDKNGEKACAENLWQYIASMLKKATLEDYIDVLKKELTTKGGLILLDGLDEVPEANNRRAEMKAIIEAFKSAFHKCRILVTSRTYAYQKQDFRIKGLTETVLAPFSPGQIRRFVDKWYAHIGELKRKSKSDAQGRAESLKYAIFHNDRIRELADRPLILTLMSSLHAWRGGSLPDKREELYASTVELLLDWWQKETVIKDDNGEYQLIQPSLLEWLKTDRDKVREVIEELAYEAHKKQPEMVGTADIAESDLISRITNVSNNQEVRPLRLIEFLRDRAGLLISRGIGVYTFPHRTFQEYLAACFLTRKNYPNYIAQLAKESPDRWREVALLAGAKSSSGGPFAVWALADELCFKSPTESDMNPQDIWGSYLAGQVLAESASLDNVSERNRQTLQRIKSWLLNIMRGDLPAIERVNAGNMLDKLGDDRFIKDYYYLPDDPMLGFVEIPGGKFIMGSDKDKDKKSFGEESPQHSLNLETFYMSKYPVTVSQYKAFLEATDKPEEEDWYQYNRFGNHPVVKVDWFNAIAYCKWLNDQLIKNDKLPKKIKEFLKTKKWHITLPSEAEWEKAARGEDGRIYPWGDEFDKDRQNYDDTNIGRPSPVGCFEKGASPFQIMEMSGNVWEWTRSIYAEYPYKPIKSIENLQDNEGARVVRGGCWSNPAGLCRVADRNRLTPDYRGGNIGFRLCLSPRSAS
jgi:formylglycine-generating enzyme required for sulfatase activity/energy-coupling factor transporter ATP-binding protein EcfA2